MNFYELPVMLRRDKAGTATQSERAVMTLLRQEPGLTRAELGRRTGLAGFSLSRIADGLIARGLLVEDAPVVRGRGYPAAPLRLKGCGAYSVGVSIMTDTARLLLMQLDGCVLGEAAFPLERVDFDWVTRRLRQAMDGLLEAEGLDRSRLAGVGVGITGFFVGESRIVNPPDPLGAWALTDLIAPLSEAFACNVWLDNDGNAAAMGEAAHGAGLRFPSFAYLFFAAGFGGGVVVDGVLMRGRHGNAGEFGACLPDGYQVPSLNRLRQLVVEYDGHDLGLSALLERIDVDSPGAQAWVEEATQSLKIIISSIGGVLDPDAVVLGGRLPKCLAERLAPRLSEQKNPERRGQGRPAPIVTPALVESDATTLGAAAMPLQDLFFR